MFKDKIGTELKYKHIYICYAGKYIGAYNPYTREVVGYEISDKFVPFVQKIIKDFPEYTPHNVINEGISELIRRKVLMDIAKKELEKTRD